MNSLCNKIIQILIVLILFVSNNAISAEITLQWDANNESDLAGYLLYYKTDVSGEPYNGTGALQGNSPIEVPLGNLSDPANPSYTLTELDGNRIYFFAVKAFNNENPRLESGYSNEVLSLLITSPENGFLVQCSNYTSYPISGKGAVGTTVEVFSGNTSLGTALVGDDCNWTLNADFTLVSEDTISIYAVNVGLSSLAVSGTNVASNPHITSPENNFLVQSSNYTSYLISGTGVSGTTVEVFSGNTSLGTAIVGDDCNWTLYADFTDVSEGIISLYAVNAGHSSLAVSGTMDITAPGISSVPQVTVTDTTAVIEWTTTEPGTSQLQYGTVSTSWDAYPFNENETPLVNTHSIAITGLTENTMYYFRAGSTDGAGNGPEPGQTNNPSIEYSFTVNEAVPPSIIRYPVVNYSNNTIRIVYDKSNMQNAMIESNYRFEPSLNFISTGGYDDITDLGQGVFLLSMTSIPENVIITLTVSNITDVGSHPVTPSSIRINDNDSDNLPDNWEIANGLNPLIDDSMEDIDGDGYTNYQEFLSNTDPANPLSMLFEVRNALPENNSGYTEESRVSIDSSFAILIHSVNGIDITHPTNIIFSIEKNNVSHNRNLGANTVRRIKLTDDPDTRVTLIWVVYDGSLDTGHWDFDADINVIVTANDIHGFSMNTVDYSFKLESEQAHNEARDKTDQLDKADADTNDPDRDVGVLINSGALKGAGVFYNSNESISPEFGPEGEIPAIDLPGINPNNQPLNFQPHTVFSTPVKIFIPSSESSDLTEQSIYYFDGSNWTEACSPDGAVLSGSEHWIVPGSRVNHQNTNPPTIEIMIYHFTGVQAGSSVSSGDSSSSSGGSGESSGGGGGGGCFISAAGPEKNIEKILCIFLPWIIIMIAVLIRTIRLLLLKKSENRL